VTTLYVSAMMNSMNKQSGTLRARVRAEMIEDIKETARRHLATDGANLSLRAVARDLGMVSSAVYRYFPSRDELLTALIIEAYDSLGDAADRAESAVPRADLRGRWMATCRAIRDWSLERPHEYALTYGSPVPGYAAPQDTIGPAARPVLLLMSLLRDGVERGVLQADPSVRIPRSSRADLRRVTEFAQLTQSALPPDVLARGMSAWTELFGHISFELFGRLQNTIEDYDAFFDFQMRACGNRIGLGNVARGAE
jgi:AcrR family transcriptional regulator